MNATEGLEPWIERQYRFAAQDMLRCVSPIDVVKRRPAFGQVVAPRRGAVLACVELADYDPDPDYFYHWHRDAAIVMDAVRLLWTDETIGDEALAMLEAFVDFNLALRTIDGGALVRDRGWRQAVAPDYVRFLRDDEELAAVHGAAAEARVNADGAIDVQRWARPQHDGPATRSLALMHWSGAAKGRITPELGAKIETLVREDLGFVLAHWRAPSFDVWEEESGTHYYTRRMQAAALAAGADWLERAGESETAKVCRAAQGEILRVLDLFWSAEEGLMLSRLAPHGLHPKALDVSVILGALHGGGEEAVHSPHDPRLAATLERIECAFAGDLPINRDGRAPAIGRYLGDSYYGGGAWHIATFAAAEFHYRAARGVTGLRRGDAFVETARRFIPDDGHMSEQIDRDSGAPSSAKRLAWSYAAFISCVAARRACLGRR